MSFLSLDRNLRSAFRDLRVLRIVSDILLVIFVDNFTLIVRQDDLVEMVTTLGSNYPPLAIPVLVPLKMIFSKIGRTIVSLQIHVLVVPESPHCFILPTITDCPPYIAIKPLGFFCVFGVRPDLSPDLTDPGEEQLSIATLILEIQVR